MDKIRFMGVVLYLDSKFQQNDAYDHHSIDEWHKLYQFVIAECEGPDTGVFLQVV